MSTPKTFLTARWEHLLLLNYVVPREVLAPLGLGLVRATRAPYLSRGDARQGLYVLDDFVGVFRPE